MQEMTQYLEGLFLASIPTALLFIVLVLAYRFLIQGPLTAALKERKARTAGAVENAHSAIAQAEATAAEYALMLTGSGSPGGYTMHDGCVNAPDSGRRRNWSSHAALAYHSLV